TIGMFAVTGEAFKLVISSVPSILGICMSVMITCGRTVLRISIASLPLVADSTAKPRSSRNRQTVCLINMESSTTKATLGMGLKPQQVGKWIELYQQTAQFCNKTALAPLDFSHLRTTLLRARAEK